MKENIASNVEKSLSAEIEKLGYNLYEVEYVKKQNGMNLTLYIDNGSEPVTIKDCEKIHRYVDAKLDELNPTKDEPYYLNVSSIGLDKPLKSDKDYNRALNKKIEVKLFTQIDGSKHFEGILTAFDDDKIVVDNNKIPRKDIASCKFYIEI